MQLEALLTYIPVDRRASLKSGQQLPTNARGAGLLADVSGFTALTEALTRSLGARHGAEELTRQLNRVYDALIEQVDLYGGTIIGFSGDAFIAWFEGEPAPQRAVTCAIRMQEAMSSFASVDLPNAERASLKVKIAIATGSARRLLIGDPAIQLVDTIVGATVTRLSDGEHLARKGEIILDSVTVQALGSACQVDEWRQDDEEDLRFAVLKKLNTDADPYPWERIDAEFLAPEDVKAWSVPALRERDDVSLTELRPAVSLFMRFDGLEFDEDDDVGAKFDAFFRWVQAIVQRYDGTVIQVTVGDKGSYLYIAFGAPVAHENSPERAAKAALELRKMPPELRFITSVQIGLTQGIMRTGAYGSRTRRTYGVLGDDVNLAARLMQHAAPGDILISQRIHKALARGFSIEELPPIRVKGKQEPLPVSRLLGQSEGQSRAGGFQRPLVGRTKEINELMAQLSPLREGKACGCVYVYGEPGIGKSHLLYEARRRLTTDDALAWYSFLTDQVVRQSLHPLHGFFDHYFQLSLGSTNAQRKTLFSSAIEALSSALKSRGDDVSRLLDKELQQARPFIGALLGLRWPGSAYEDLNPRLRFERSLQGVVTLFCAESLRKPFVLHIRDAQWLDDDTRELLQMLLVSSTELPLAVLIDSRYRDDGTPITLTTSSSVSTYTMNIQQLSPEGVRELAAVVLGGGTADALTAYLIRKANGNPFFSEQLALDLSERGSLIRTHEGVWELRPNFEDDIPVNINAVLIARLDRLIAQVRSIVQIASVLGQEFEISVLSRMVKDDPEMHLKVKQAEDETIWFSRDDWYYLFRHALLRDAAYSMQLQERLRELHALAGWAIEQVYSAEDGDKAADIAYHYEKSAVYERAIVYLIRAAQYMASLYANREALSYYERAMKMRDKVSLPPEEIAPIYEGVADLYETMGEYALSVSHYDTALSLVGQDHPAWRTKLYRKKGQVAQKWGRYDEATQYFEAGLVELQSDLNAEEACQIYSGLAMINYRQERIEDALELASLAWIMAQTQEDKRNLAQALQNLGVVHWKNGDIDQALEFDQQSLLLWKEAGISNGQAAVHNNLGLLYQGQQRVEEAIQHFEQSIRLFAQVGNQHGLAWAHDNIGQAYMQSGDQERAIEHLEKAVAILAKIGLDDNQVYASMWQAGTW